tara:strand:- start:463 stop:846 length:384 start_codon:yes stop_codon:yes gene_type:complete
MIVRFKATFHVPGFGRRRFSKGVVDDVPESLRDKLPSSAEILDDDFVEKKKKQKVADDELKGADYARAAAEGTDQEALEKAGLAGFSDEALEIIDAEEEAADEAEELAEAEEEAAEDVKPTRKNKGK